MMDACKLGENERALSEEKLWHHGPRAAESLRGSRSFNHKVVHLFTHSATLSVFTSRD